MAPKRKISEVSKKGKSIVPKIKREVYTLAQKLKVLDMYAAGKSTAQIVTLTNISESTLRGIRSDKDKIKKMALSSGDLTKKTAAYTRRDPYLDRMEQLLNVYVTYSREQNIPVSGAMLQTKALELYTKIRKKRKKRRKKLKGQLVQVVKRKIYHGLLPVEAGYNGMLTVKVWGLTISMEKLLLQIILLLINTRPS